MPFTVKATYGRSSEIRKLSFPAFPSYDQLYNQLYRVFPINHSYYLSKLVFSSDSSNTPVLLATEVHNAEQYSASIAPYLSGFHPNPMLRFTVYDETPHKLPAGFVPDDTTPTTLTGVGVPQPFISLSHIPPPPIILSSGVPSAKIDLDTADYSNSPASVSTLKPQQQHHHGVPQSTAASSVSCCAVNQGKIEMQEMVDKFKEDLDRILKSSFADSAPTPLAPPPPCFMPPPTPSFCLFKYCSNCAKIFQGPWYACEKCSTVVCLGCHENQNSGFCVAAMAPHVMKKESCAACPVDTPPTRVPPTPWAPLSNLPPTGLTPPWNPPQQHSYSPIYPFGAPTPVMPFIPPNQLPRVPAPTVPPPAQAPSPPPPPPVIHRGVVCDMCDNVIEGIRHKCLDCPDYDLCTPCISSGSAERHNPFHEFLEIKEPGRVIVHTVYSGDGERDAPTSSRAPGPAPPPPPPPPPQVDERPAVHFATCNLCDSRIRGDRYKCADCPDFDTCSNCFSITAEQHPLHSFVRLTKASDYIRRDRTRSDMHFVTCNGCSKTVYGIRYKCMHPDCPDFDLCENCEAFPIAMHPNNHPLLKMRSPSTVIPTVYRVGQTTLIDSPNSRLNLNRSPSPVLAPQPPMPSFETYLANRIDRRNTMPASFFEAAPSTLPPSSPRFFRSNESSRSNSPALSFRAPRPLSPPYMPRPASPIMMPGGLYDEPPFARQPQPSFPIGGFPYDRAPPTTSRFSHSPSPSPPLFRDRSRSPSPPRLSHQVSWGLPLTPSVPSSVPQQLQPQQHFAPPWSYFDDLAAATPAARVPLAHRDSIGYDSGVASAMARERQSAIAHLAETHRMLEHRVDETQLRWGGIAVPPPPPLPPMPAAPTTEPVPSLPGSYWPTSSEELRHLMQHEPESSAMQVPVLDAFSRLSVQDEAAVMDSPLTNEALLNHPLEMPTETLKSVFEEDREPIPGGSLLHQLYAKNKASHSLAALLNGYDNEDDEKELEKEKEQEKETEKDASEPSVDVKSDFKISSGVYDNAATTTAAVGGIAHTLYILQQAHFELTEQEAKAKARQVVEVPEPEPEPVPTPVPAPAPVPAPVSTSATTGLRASFVNDVTLPDGQIFPPGAEFMKCWQMANSGGVDWPADTELVWVAGERLARVTGGPASVPVGVVKVGAQIEVWTGELKAPEAPGRYVSYWRLRDGQGKLFGDSLWIDINVTETRSNESSLSSSSIIVMPRGAQSVPASAASAASVAAASVQSPQVEEDSDVSSDSDDSDSSSVSLVSMPSEEEDEEWASVPASEEQQSQRYVVLYDDASSEEDE